MEAQRDMETVIAENEELKTQVMITPLYELHILYRF